MVDIPPPPPPLEDAPPPPFKRRCRDCPPASIGECRRRFDAWWRDKSHGGTGCDNPVDTPISKGSPGR